MLKKALLCLAVIFCCWTWRDASAQTPPGCAQDSVYHLLDFWTGDWQVFVGDTAVGTNRVVKVLGDCAVEEHWRDTSGHQGFSLFYVEPQSGHWRQVWVTEWATVPGGLKEKRWLATE